VSFFIGFSDEIVKLAQGIATKKAPKKSGLLGKLKVPLVEKVTPLPKGLGEGLRPKPSTPDPSNVLPKKRPYSGT